MNDSEAPKGDSCSMKMGSNLRSRSGSENFRRATHKRIKALNLKGESLECFLASFD